MKKTYPTESQEQSAFVAWMRLQHPMHRVIAIPNGGLRNIITAVRMKKEGVQKGVPDLFIPSLNLWIEMKRQKGGRVAVEQSDWIEYLKFHHYKCRVCNGADEAINLIKEILNRDAK